MKTYSVMLEGSITVEAESAADAMDAALSLIDDSKTEPVPEVDDFLAGLTVPTDGIEEVTD